MSEQRATQATGVLVKFRPDKSAEWPEHIKELAFQSWAFWDNHNANAVARRFRAGELAMDDQGEPLVIELPVRTIQQWVIDCAWHDRHEQFIQQSFGSSLKLSLGHQVQIMVNGSHRIDEQIRNGDSPDRNLIEAVRLAACVVGLSSIGSRDPSKGVLSGGQRQRNRALDILSDDELLEMERKLSEPDE